MNTCYFCGKEIRDEAELLMKDVDIGFLELSHERKPFHRECWETRKRKERMRYVKVFAAVALIFVGLGVFLIVFPILHALP